MNKDYHYHWLHLPTNTTGVSIVAKIDRLSFLELLNQWNRVGSDWKYWEKP